MTLSPGHDAMCALIGDRSPLNRRFLRAAAGHRGFDAFVEVATMRDLIDAATTQQPQLILFDPSLDDDEGLDVFEELWLASKTSFLVVVSANEKTLANARAHGVAVVVKRSINHLGDIEAAILPAVPVPDRVVTAMIPVMPVIHLSDVIRLDAEVPEQASEVLPVPAS